MPIDPSAPARIQPSGYHSALCATRIFLSSMLLLPGFAFPQEGGGTTTVPAEGAGVERRAEGGTPAPRPLAGGIFRSLRELTPPEQRRAMANDPRFLRLPTERQQLIRERLQQWNSMTPQEKERIRQREEILEGLSPAQRQESRNIFPQWRDLTAARRQAVMVAFRHLRDLPPDQRRAFLDSPHVREQFSPHERNILEGLNKLLPASRAPAPADPVR